MSTWVIAIARAIRSCQPQPERTAKFQPASKEEAVLYQKSALQLRLLLRVLHLHRPREELEPARPVVAVEAVRDRDGRCLHEAVLLVDGGLEDVGDRDPALVVLDGALLGVHVDAVDHVAAQLRDGALLRLAPVLQEGVELLDAADVAVVGAVGVAGGELHAAVGEAHQRLLLAAGDEADAEDAVAQTPYKSKNA